MSARGAPLDSRRPPRWRAAATILAILALPLRPSTAHPQDATPYDLLLRHARILDGSGNPWWRGDVAVRDGRIAALGDLAGRPALREVDVADRYLAPGFIDVHSHAADALCTPERSPATPLLLEGVTTVVVNPDGGGPTDLTEQRTRLLEHGLGINVAQLIGHGSVREAVLGNEDRLAAPEELERMRQLVEQAMRAGAFGVSSGPFYAPGSYSDTGELVAVAEVAARFGGTYTSHIRDESSYSIGLLAAVDEVITVAERALLPVVVTHIKALGPDVWGKSVDVVAHIQNARDRGLEVYADQYPYLASSTSLSAALMPRWAVAGSREEVAGRLADPATRERIRAAMREGLARRGGADRIAIAAYAPQPELAGHTLAQIAEQRRLDPIDAALSLLGDGDASIISFNMDERDLETFLEQPWTMTASDGGYPQWGEGKPHPRSFGTFARKIRRFVVEKQTLDLADAVRTMTSLPAQVFHIAGRGVVREGAYADLVVFDLARLRDRATYEDPFQTAEGVDYVVVNGELAVDAGTPTGALAGRVLERNR